MNRTLKRPMFRMGGSTGTGITSGLDTPRQGYKEPGVVNQNDVIRQDAQRIFDVGVDLRKANQIPTDRMLYGSVPSLLTSFGLNLMSFCYDLKLLLTGKRFQLTLYISTNIPCQWNKRDIALKLFAI